MHRLRRSTPRLLLALAALLVRNDGLARELPSGSSDAPSDPMDIPSFVALPRPQPDLQLRYGDADAQAIDVFLPRGPGPFPVVALIHGGCWSAKTAARDQLRHLGAELAHRGIAVWSLGYRRADEDGGGYPGTFQDVARALDRLRDEAPALRFDLSRTVVVGHSAGGHLALWAAGRDRLPEDSPLYATEPFVPRQVISVAGVGDLEKFSPLVPGICGPGIIENLTGRSTPQRPDVYAETSPAVLGANGVQVVMFSGVLDRLVPPYVAHDYERAVRGRVAVERVEVADAGHFDLVANGPAWARIRDRIEALLKS